MTTETSSLNSKTRSKSLKRLVLTLLAVCAGLILLLPTLIGSRWIYQPLLERLAVDEFKLQVESVHLRWLTPLELRGVTIQQADGSTLLAIPQVQTDRGFVRYLLGGRQFGKLTILDPSIDIQLLEKESNLGRLIKAIQGSQPSTPGKEKSRPPAIDIDLSVQRLSLQVQRAGDKQPLVVIPPFNLDFEYRAADGISHVDIQPTHLLDHVALSPELMKLGMELAVPLLAQSSWFDGKVSISTDAIHIPLDSPAESTGSMTIVLHQVRSGPSNPVVIQLLDLAARKFNREPTHEFVFVDGASIQIRVSEGRVFHDGMQVGLPKVDPQWQISTSGSVGILDKTLDLTARIPIPVEDIAWLEQVKAMGTPTVRLAIGGTLDVPVVEWNVFRNDLKSLLGTMASLVETDEPAKGALLSTLGTLAEGQADDAIVAGVSFLQQVVESRRAKKQGSQAEKLPESLPVKPSDATDGSDRQSLPVRDLLRGLLRGRSN